MGLDLSSTLDRCKAYAPRMSTVAVFSHSTALRLHGAPLPSSLPEALHVTMPVPGRAPAVAGVVGHRQRLASFERTQLNGLAVASPAAAWAQSAELLSRDDLIAVGEYFITGNPFARQLPLCDLVDLRTAAQLRERGAGHRVRMAALAEIRAGALSRPETLVRLLLARCGLPDPVVNGEVLGARGEFIAMLDLQWPGFRVALEYQGDHHREQGQFRRDISRLERLIDADWLVVQVTAAELFGDPRAIVERVARRLRSRGWVGRIDLRLVAAFQR